MSEENDALFNFPCEFPIKAMGLAQENFDELVVTIIRRHCQDLTENAVITRASKGGKYISVTVTITAHSRAQLDVLYTELSQHEQVLMVL